MDVFSLFGYQVKWTQKSRAAQKGPIGTGRSMTRLPGLVVSVRDKSVLFFDDGSGREAFVPVSKVMDWWFTACGTKRGLRLCDLELNDEVTILVPTWLARKEKLG